jgi:hypothetical protein
MITPQLKNKPEYVTQTYNFKHVINHVDIVQAEAEFVEKYSHLLDDNQLINRTLVDYETKTITIEAYSTSLFYPIKEHNKGFIFNISSIKDINDFFKVFESLGITSDDFTLYSKENKLVTISNKLTKQIINDAKAVIELESRGETFVETYRFDKRPNVSNLLHAQLKFITDNKLHEDDITFVSINSDDEDFATNVNTITITGKQSAKHKTYSDDVAAIINSCVIVDRFESLLESALKEGSDDVIQRVISYQHPIVNDETLELLEAPIPVNISQVLNDNSIETQSIHEEITPPTKLDIKDEVAEFITDIPNNLEDMLAETEAYENLQKIKDGISKNDPLVALSLTEDEIKRLKAFLSNNKYPTNVIVSP